jgi:hypothetical protein
MKLLTFFAVPICLLSCSPVSDQVESRTPVASFGSLPGVYLIIATDQTTEAALALARYRTGESQTIDSAVIVKYEAICSVYPTSEHPVRDFVAYACSTFSPSVRAVFLFGTPSEVDSSLHLIDYADINGDTLPEIAVGRLEWCPADLASRYVEKIKRYESTMQKKFLTVIEDSLHGVQGDPLRQSWIYVQKLVSDILDSDFVDHTACDLADYGTEKDARKNLFALINSQNGFVSLIGSSNETIFTDEYTLTGYDADLTSTLNIFINFAGPSHALSGDGFNNRFLLAENGAVAIVASEGMSFVQQCRPAFESLIHVISNNTAATIGDAFVSSRQTIETATSQHVLMGEPLVWVR